MAAITITTKLGIGDNAWVMKDDVMHQLTVNFVNTVSQLVNQITTTDIKYTLSDNNVYDEAWVGSSAANLATILEANVVVGS